MITAITIIFLIAVLSACLYIENRRDHGNKNHLPDEEANKTLGDSPGNWEDDNLLW